MAVTITQRTEAGWKTEILEGPTAVLKLPVMDVEIPFTRIYERTAVAEKAGT